MKNKGHKNNQTMKLAIISSVVLLTACKAVPPKQGTAIDYIKADLQLGIIGNNKLYAKNKLPKALAQALMPGYKQTRDKDVNLDRLPKNKFNVLAEGVPAKSFFLGLVEDTNVNVVLHPNVTGELSLKLKAATIPEVLAMVERVYGYGFEVVGSSVKIFPSSLQTKSYKVSYLDMERGGLSETKISSSGVDSSDSDSDDGGDDDSGSDSSSSSGSSSNSKISTTSTSNFWKQLQTTLKDILGGEEGRKVSVSPMSGHVIITALPDELRQVEKYLRESELMLNRQVILEAKILEVELSDGYRSGINWGTISSEIQAGQIGNSLHGSDNFDAVTIGNNQALAGGANLFERTRENLRTPFSSGVMNGFGGILSLGFNYKKFAAFMEMLSSQGNVQVLSSPRISTTNNQKALIKVGQDRFFVTEVTNASSSVAGVTSTSSPSISFDSFFSGIALDVTPNIDSEGNVTLHIHPTISTVSDDKREIDLGGGTVQIFPLAKSTVRESDSIVRAKNGELVVIGGLMQEKTNEVVTGVPLLMKIPFLGSMFRHTRQQSKKSELVILLRPIVIENGVWNKELEKNNERFKELDRGFHIGGNTEVFGSLGESY